jgi:iron(III) transport system ATP-binding protein
MSVVVSDLHVHYPGRPHAAVAGVSLALEAGQMGVLIGPSGCGKTTLLRAVAGLEPVRSGEIRIKDQVVSSAQAQVPAEQRRIGMVFQDYALFPHLDVGRNVAFGLHGWDRARQAARVAQVLEWVGLQSSERRHPHELSGGQQQRVALARALAPQPQLLLLDEPFSNLDVDLRERLAKEVRAILKQAQATALFVTHDQMEAFALGDVIGVMSEGRLEQWADAYSLYHRPATRFVADFIGHGVFLPGLAGAGVVQTPLGPLPLPASAPVAHGACDVLFRADDIVHDDDAPLKAAIREKAFRGSEFLYTLQLAGGEMVVAHVPSHHDHQVGELIGIRAELDHVVTFAVT